MVPLFNDRNKGRPALLERAAPRPYRADEVPESSLRAADVVGGEQRYSSSSSNFESEVARESPPEEKEARRVGRGCSVDSKLLVL